MFKLTCLDCGKEVIIDNNEGHFQKDGITIFEAETDDLEIECECGNKVVL